MLNDGTADRLSIAELLGRYARAVDGKACKEQLRSFGHQIAPHHR